MTTQQKYVFSSMCQKMSDLAKHTQTNIITGLQGLETTPFKTDLWERPGGGGGITKVIENGSLFEKGGVNTSEVQGTITEKEMPMFKLLLEQQGLAYPKIENPMFFATGVSLVLHPKNPMAPTVHANYRYFELESDQDPIWWFGGGCDLTPNYLFEDDAVHFHKTLQNCCNQHDSSYYPKFKEKCDNYFYIPHRNETRGIGGIFFDYLNDKPKEQLFNFVQDGANCFLDSYLPIIEKRMATPYTEEQQQWQSLRRGRYVEFNLVYDRGTLFGLKTNGRTESILMSLPKTANWSYDHRPEPGSEEDTLLSILKTPRNWV